MTFDHKAVTGIASQHLSHVVSDLRVGVVDVKKIDSAFHGVFDNRFALRAAFVFKAFPADTNLADLDSCSS
jgi:hypothetical protein